MIFRFTSLYQKLEKIEQQLSKNHEIVDGRLTTIEKIQAVQEANLKEHMRRSDNLEKIVTDMEKKDIQPVKRHVAMVEGALKLLGIIGILVSIVSGILKIFNVI